jgi:phosphate-selective porin OprO/OprP
LNNIFRGQVAGQNCLTASYSCPSELSATVRNRAVGLEGIVASGPFKLAGEYSMGDYRGTASNFTTSNQVAYDTKTYYVEAGWFITGEKYAGSYKNGVFSSFKPINEFDLDKGNWGAIEALFRAEAYEVADVEMKGSSSNRVQGNLSQYTSAAKPNEYSQTGVTSGAKTYTAGIRWILNPNIVIKGNYSYTKFDNMFQPLDVDGATVSVKDEQLVMFRTQYMF